MSIMSIRFFAAFLACSFLATTAARGDDVKEIAIKAFKAKLPAMPSADKPTEIKSVEELEKIFPAKDDADALKKEVDFAKQKLMLFAWSGSGGDTIFSSADKDEVTFLLRRGLTRDLRAHQQLFAIPKDAKFKFETAK